MRTLTAPPLTEHTPPPSPFLYPPPLPTGTPPINSYQPYITQLPALYMWFLQARCGLLFTTINHNHDHGRFLYARQNIYSKYEKHTKIKIKYTFAFTLYYANATDFQWIP